MMENTATIAEPQSLSQLLHDLRTPLNQIIGFSEMLFELAGDEGRHDLKEGLAIVRDAGLELNKLLSDSERLSLEVRSGENLWPLVDSIRPPVSRIKSFLDLTLPTFAEPSLSGYTVDLQKVSAAVDDFHQQVTNAHLLIRLDEFLQVNVTDLAQQATPVNSLAGRILIIDDEILNREILCRRLQREGCEPTGVRGGREAMALLQLETFDAVLLDIVMPEMSGMEVLQILKKDPRWRDLPVIMLSALNDVDRAARCIELGAEDYLPKPINVVLLRARLGACLEKKRLRDQDQQNLRALYAEKERLSVTLGSLADAVVATDAQGRIVLFSDAAASLSKLPASDAIGQPFEQVFAIYRRSSRLPVPSAALEAIEKNAVIDSSHGLATCTPEGLERLVATRSAPIHGPHGEIIGTVVVLRDITEQEKLAEELLRSSKLQSIGVLAGGLAHEFNNMLTAILGNLSLMRHLHIPRELVPLTDEVERGAVRARELTQYLLTFAEGGVPMKEILHPGKLMDETIAFTKRGHSSQIQSSFQPELWSIEADPNQLMQVVSNIVMNAIEATMDGSLILLSAANVSTKADAVPGLPPGDYVCIAVQDRGVGIMPENLPLIYDPFFTTKKHARGLGLAAAYSIIQRHGGQIVTESAIGAGTRVSFYLPGVLPRPQAEEIPPIPDAIHPPAANQAQLVSKKRVLVMDDEEPIRTLATMMLDLLGYEVATASDGEEAVATHERALLENRPFDYFVSDLNIPGGLGGREAIRMIREKDTQLVAIVSSGYSNDPVMANYHEYGFDGVLAKPYLFEDMSQLLKDLQRS